MENAPKYKRVLLKISGESLAGPSRFGIDEQTVHAICQEIRQIVDMGVQVGIVCGGGNFWRGRSAQKMDRTRADHAGMLATVINGIALTDALLSMGVETRLQTAIEMRQIAEPYIRGRAENHLKKGYVVIFAGGTGNPYFSTDTAAALRAAEINADAILLAKTVSGVYSADPAIDKTAQFLPELTYLEVLNRRLGVMDTTATSLCMDNRIPIVVFGISDPHNIVKAAMGERIGTTISE